MHITTLNYDELVKNGICVKFASILSDPKSYHPDLDIIIGETDWDYFIPEGVTDVVPLCDQNADSVVRWKRNNKIEYVLLYHDDPEWSQVAISEQGVKAVLWSKWCEFQENDSECYKFAEAIDFKYSKEASEMWEEDYDKFQIWKKNLVD